MSTHLTQSSAASFPDRPGAGGVGLQISMSTGDEGSYLTHDLGAEQSDLHVRLMMNPVSASGGTVTLLAGLNATGLETLRVSLDTDTGDLLVWFPGGTSLSAALGGGVSWHCVEVSVDTVSDQAELWINGVLQGQVDADLSASTVQTVLLGAIYKDTNVIGDLYLDEIVFADSYIGPVLVETSEAHAGDPARWLVVYNTADPDAGDWAESYRQARGVPFANLAGLALPLTENIDSSEYESFVTAVEDYLALNQLGGQVMGVLLGYRVPGYIDSIGGGMFESVPAHMQTSSTTLGSTLNPHALPTSYDRLGVSDLAGLRMTARIDGPDLASANELISRATAISGAGLYADTSLFYFDPFVGDGASYQTAFDDMVHWAVGDGGMKIRLNIILSGDPAGNDDAGFDSVSGDGLFWGWSLSLPDPDIFDSPAGQRALCGQVYLDGASATTLRNTAPGNWADTPIAAGYAGVIASSRDTPVGWMPDARALFDALTLGWTLAEAWFVAQPIVRGGFYLVGDPLMRISMPRTGTEVFGPLDNLADLNPDSPAFVLPEGLRELDISDAAPVDGGQGVYVVRRTDEHGRDETSMTSVRLAHIAGQSLRPPLMPVWPDVADWKAGAEDAEIRLLACWDGPIGSMEVGSVELMSQPEAGPEVVLSQPVFNHRDEYVVVVDEFPVVRTRYRWRVTSSDGVVMHTAWSAYIDPPVLPTTSLEQIGANS